MQLIVSWVAFPLVIAALGAGWGVLAEKAAGREIQGPLMVALGLMAALVAAALVTATTTTASAAVAVVSTIAVVGLGAGWPWRRLRDWRVSRWPLMVALGALLAYGAPVILSGRATFAGYTLLDDTATWLGITDQVFSHARAVALTPPSSYGRVLDGYLHVNGYPTGAFMLLGVGRGVLGVDAAWVFQPYLACCGALVGLSAYGLFGRWVVSRPLRAGLAFVAAQPALLYGYSLSGAIKELTTAWVLLAGIALVEPYVGRGAPRPREMLVLALPAAALVTILGAGAVIWVALPLVALAVSWGRDARRTRDWHALGASSATLVAATGVLALPALLIAGRFLATDDVLFAAPSGGPIDLDALGGLLAPLSPFQLAGIWPVGDFRLTAPTVPTAILVTVVLAAGLGTLAAAARERRPGVPLYVVAVLGGVVAVELAGGSPWLVGKALAMGSPAVLACGLLGAVLLLERSRLAGAAVCAVIAGGVLWSNALAYHDVRLAPRPRLEELKHVGEIVSGKGPTFINEAEIYAARHFLGGGAPTSFAEFRQPPLKLRGGETLDAASYADLDSYPLATLLSYRSIVTSRSPTQSRPPSVFKLVWQGRWYEVWQRAAAPEEVPLAHVAGGDSNVLPYCGTATGGPARNLCSIIPASVPPCSIVREAGAAAARVDGRVVAFQRQPPIVVRAKDVRPPRGWRTDPATGEVVASRPGTLALKFRLDAPGRYGIWIGGTFAQALDVSLDGRTLGRIADARGGTGTYDHVATVRVPRGAHTVSITYAARGGIAPGDGGPRYDALLAVALDPLDETRSQILSVAPDAAKSLCGRPLDWIEVVTATR